MKRADRLFALAELLRARRTGITADALAERFEVSVRTIHRDLDTLRRASLPIHGERGRGGGLALDHAYSMPPVNFTAREAAVLVAAGRWLGHTRILPFVDTLRAATDKVQAALPKPKQREVARLAESLAWIGVPARAPPPDVRAAVEKAWVHDLPLSITYNGSHGRTQRRVRIEQVLLERTTTMLNCLDLDLRTSRQFQLHRIEAAHCPATR
ncbi:MAG: HTH domain-containing protein [Myxococcota bacterium]